MDIDLYELNRVIDADQLSTMELGYLLRIIGLLEPHSSRLPYGTKTQLSSAMGVSRKSGSGAIRALEGVGIMYRKSGEYYLSSDIIVGGKQYDS